MDSGEGEVVPVFKLHGSVNWTAPHGVGVGADPRAAERQGGGRGRASCEAVALR